MSTEPPSLDALLERLNSGDEAAATQVFQAYEPYLRMVVRRQFSGRLRAKFDSVDIVQSVWADLWSGFRAGTWKFTDSAHLRAFLVRVTRNRFLNRVRDHRHALDHEQSYSDSQLPEEASAPQPRPSEMAQAHDLWDRLLELCPPAHRELLRLKRQGLTLAELAAHTGLHPSSVRRVLYQLADQMAKHCSGVRPALLLADRIEAC
jgi:RNA polymerase sigma-70 factor (ECF subfamily)